MADQFLLKAGAISERDFRAQILDGMDLITEGYTFHAAVEVLEQWLNRYQGEPSNDK